MQKVAFICVHNSCRSQIAESLGKKLASDVFESYSAGTETKPRINQDAVRLMKQVHGIDMEESQYSKLLSDIPPVDVVITMGCNVQCPFLPCSHREDWGLEDPTGKSDEAFLETIRLIEQKILELKAKEPLILTGGATFFLCVGCQDGHHQFAVGALCVDVLLFKENVHLPGFEITNGL